MAIHEMTLTKDQLLDKLTVSGVAYQVIEHEAVVTAEAQAKVLASTAGHVIQSVFLKDKKARLYIISALMSTKIDLKVLSARLGLGKGGIKMADPGLVEEVVKVSQQSLSPLAVANLQAGDVILLLDHKILSEENILMHPLVDNASVSMTPVALQAAIQALGYEANFVDLEIEPKITKENPPDLAKYVPEAPATPAAAAASSAPQAANGQQQAAPAASSGSCKAAAASSATAASKLAAKAGRSGPAVDGKTAAAAQLRALSDCGRTMEEVLQKVCKALLGCNLEEAKVSDPYILARLKADVEMQLNSFKNAAYTAGYIAGKGEIVGFAEKRYA